MAKKKAVRKKPVHKTHPLSRASRLFLPYPIFLFVMLCVGVLLYMWTFKTEAIDYTVKAKVPAPPLTEPAIIESPANGSRFSEVPITVKGSCPLDSYVSLYRNNVYSGSVLCTADKKFEISIDLFEGANELLPRVYNLTDDEGPASNAITIYYDHPVTQSGTGGTTAPPAAADKLPLLLKSDFKLIGYYVGQEVKIGLEISGGISPYALSVDWGDGITDLISQKDEGRLTVKHIYNGPGGERGNYKIRISLTDNAGTKTFLQMFTIVNLKDTQVPGIATAGGGPADFSLNSDLLKLLWPAYIVVFLMALSFWLGEREELLELRRQAVRRKRRA